MRVNLDLSEDVLKRLSKKAKENFRSRKKHMEVLLTVAAKISNKIKKVNHGKK